MTELWKDIEGYDGLYQVSNLGRVRSMDCIKVVHRYGQDILVHYKGKIRKQFVSKRGYMFIPMPNHHLSVHREVAKAFVPGYFDGAQVNHKDENKLNNIWTNLEWVTCKDNINYGTHNEKCLVWNEENKGVKVDQYTLDGKLVATHPSISKAAKAVGVTRKTISDILNTNYISRGFRFKTN